MVHTAYAAIYSGFKKREPPTLLGRRSFLFPKGVFIDGCVRFRLSEASGGMIDAYGGNNEGFLFSFISFV